MLPILDRDDEFRDTVTILFKRNFGHNPDADQLLAGVIACRNGITGEELDALYASYPEAIAYHTKPVLPTLHIVGHNFVDEQGKRYLLKGTDQFCAYHQFRDGGEEALKPLIDESNRLEFNMWRVFLMGDKSRNNILDLRPDEGFYSKLKPFADYLNKNGIILLATVFVDAQGIIPDVIGQKGHWRQVASELYGSVTLLSGGNEWKKNGFDPGDLTDPQMFWSRGSDLGDESPYRPYADFAEFHPRRDLPKAEDDTVASPNFIYYNEGLQGPLIIDEPIGFAEENVPGRRSNDPELAWRFGRLLSTKCAGAVFHNDCGMRGQLMTPRIEECAIAWQRGMRVD